MIVTFVRIRWEVDRLNGGPDVYLFLIMLQYVWHVFKFQGSHSSLRLSMSIQYRFI